jgi:hypothetical protein
MADKKNLVIKVKYPAGAKKLADPPSVQTVTEWNIPRLTGAVAMLAVLMVGVVKMLSPTEKTPVTTLPSVAVVPVVTIPQVAVNTPSPQTTSVAVAKPVALASVPVTKHPVQTTASQVPVESTPKANVQTVAQATTPAIAEPTNANTPAIGNVSRALLTHTVKKREPMTEIARVIGVSKRKPAVVYYFTEVEGMAGHDIFHEWSLDGKAVTRYKLDVAGDPWRTFSRMAITTKGKGVWTVRLLDDNNRMLNQQAFKVNSR